LSIKDSIIKKSKDLGFSKIGFASVRKLEREADFLQLWHDNNYSAGMDYIIRNKEFRADPTIVLPEAKTVIALAYNYYKSANRKSGIGKISRHAWGEDYHTVVKTKIREFASYIESVNGEGFKYFISLDGGKAFEKRWAEIAGIGWQGKHSLIINKEYGSWSFLGLIICNLDVEYDEEHKNHCGACRKCIEACPTGAIVADKVVDARKCLSFLTIEDRKNMFSDNFNSSANYIYGCDICQEVCPWNRKAKISEDPAFEPINDETELATERIIGMHNDDFKIRFENSPILRIKLKKLKSNAEALINCKKED
jgi:epoxyqueuosine reductase